MVTVLGKLNDKNSGLRQISGHKIEKYFKTNLIRNGQFPKGLCHNKFTSPTVLNNPPCLPLDWTGVSDCKVSCVSMLISVTNHYVTKITISNLYNPYTAY